MDALSFLGGVIGGVATTVSALLALLTLREKLWPKKASTPHPLEPVLRDIATAIRDHLGAA